MYLVNKLGDLIEEGMYIKLTPIPENASLRLHDILSKIVNKGKSNVILIVFIKVLEISAFNVILSDIRIMEVVIAKKRVK